MSIAWNDGWVDHRMHVTINLTDLRVSCACMVLLVLIGDGTRRRRQGSEWLGVIKERAQMHTQHV